MSSHHIVREKQEPALLVANGPECSDELLGQLLEWSPFVVVLDNAYERLIHKNIKVDVLLGDFDDGVPSEEDVHFPTKIIHTPNQEKTDLEKGIEYLIAEGFPAVNIIWATGKRMDHTFANLCNLPKYSDHIKIVMIDDHSKIYPLTPSPSKFEKWYKAKTIISLLPLGEVNGIKTVNLKYPLRDESLQIGRRLGNSNEVSTDGVISVSFTSGSLLLMECED